jgi:Flp pilus assembly protein CpaB
VTTTDTRQPAPPEAPSTGRPALRSPAARRLAPARWRDRRLALGVALVLLAVLLGARLLATGGATTAVLEAAVPLPVGHVLVPGDLTVVHVRLGAADRAYWSAGDQTGLQGHPMTTSVATGDLLPRSAVGATASPQPTREVAVPVDPSRLPPLAPGDLVDIFATSKSSSGEPGVTVAILRGVTYVGGGDSDSSGTVTVRLQVPVAATGTLVRASETASLDVVLEQPAGDDAGDVGGQPVAAPTSAATHSARP